MTYQVWYGNVMIGQFTEPEFAQPLIEYGKSLELYLEILPENKNRARFDWKFNTIECHMIIWTRLGVKI